jgi:hypothetical protein
MLRIIGSLVLFAAIVAGGVYLYGADADGAKCDQACIAESGEEP